MKSEIVKCLLDFYVQERNKGFDVPDGIGKCHQYQNSNVKHIPEATVTHVLQGPVALDSTGILGAQDIRSHTVGTISPSGLEYQLGQQGTVTLDSSQQEKCKNLAKNLVIIAEHFEKSLQDPFSEHELCLSKLPSEGLDDKELQVLKDIQSTKSPSVSNIATYLSNHLTSRTFKGALVHLCAQATSYQQELALVCELYNVVSRYGPRRESITEVVINHLENRPELDAL